MRKSATAALGVALAVRVVRSRWRRSLHPTGRSFAATVEVYGLDGGVGSAFLDRPGRYRATVRLSKGAGTRGDRPDIRGLAVRVHLPESDFDLLLSTAGRGRFTRHLPMPRRTFDAMYGTITAYRTGSGEKVYLAARPDPDGPVLGQALDDLAEGEYVLLEIRRGHVEVPVGRVTWDRALSEVADAALAFNPVRNSLPDLHPTGLVHGARAYAYPLSQRWRGLSR